jgi:DNA replication and repair protein RecF
MADVRLPVPVHILSLKLTDFRNHTLARLEPGAAALVALTGPNGVGKTNLLEALSLLSVGRGLRGAAPGAMARLGGPGGFQVAAALANDPALPPVDLRSFTQPAAPERRRLRVNGATAPLAQLSQWLAVLWATPAMDRLFAEPASARRRFLDRLALALHPDHAFHSSRYDAAMRARNRLLAGERAADTVWLAALEAQMEEHGTTIRANRADTVDRLAARLAAVPEGAFPRAAISLDAAPLDALADRLAADRAADRAAGRTRAGPHRDDLAVVHAAKDMPAALASTGEQKALLLGLLLAHADGVAAATGRTPLLLIDEAPAHLDRERRTALYARLAASGGQTWLSGTDPALFEGAQAVHYHIDNGMITPIDTGRR